MNRHMQQIDHQTGEVVEGFVAYVVPKRKNGFQKGWMACKPFNQEADRAWRYPRGVKIGISRSYEA